MRLLYNRVAIEEIQLENKSESLIALPESAKTKENVGVVVAVGEGTRTQTGDLIPMQVKIGDRVLFERVNAVSTSIQGKKVLIMGEASIIAILGE
jgi:chaperonin GroES